MATDTEAGNLTAFEGLESLTIIAPLLVPGTALRVTEPLADFVPGTELGLMLMETSWKGLTTKVVPLLTVPVFPEIVTV